jgi:chitinase domain-containing protein 1
MAKKRERRVAPSSSLGKGRVESSDSSTQPDQLGHSSSSDRRLRLILVFVLFFIVSPAISVLVYRIKYASPTNRTDSYVFQRGLVKDDVDYQEILAVSTLPEISMVLKLH